jgi:hypothetical protein
LGLTNDEVFRNIWGRSLKNPEFWLPKAGRYCNIVSISPIAGAIGLAGEKQERK